MPRDKSESSSETPQSILAELIQSHPGLFDAPYAEMVQLPRRGKGSVLVSVVQLPEPIGAKFREAFLRAVSRVADPTWAALLTRGLDAIARVGAHLDESESAAILASPTDQEVLLDLVAHSPRTQSDVLDDPLLEAKLRGATMREEILSAEGGVWNATDVGKHLHISRQAVDRRRANGRLLALPIGARSYAYPRWQFTDDGVLPGLTDVLQSFTLPGAWTRAAFFLSPNSYLNGATPLGELRRGNVDAVSHAAARFGEQGAA
jgi:hypothetical protein